MFLKVSLGLYVVDKNNSDHHELCIDLLTLNEEVFLVNGKIGLEKDIVVLGFNFILSLIEFQHIESFFENWISVAEEHFENIEQKYALLPLVTSKSSYRTH